MNTQHSLISKIAVLISTVFYIGYIPKASGTFGSLFGLLLYPFIAKLGFIASVGVITFLFLLGCWSAHVSGKIFGDHDSSKIVVDEVVGVWITLLGSNLSLISLITGFVLFRLFDIIKPQPAQFFDEKVHSAFGTMMDDVVAGMYGLGVLLLFSGLNII